MRLHEALRLLGLTAGWTLADAKAAYKKLALEYHPDRNNSEDANEKMQRIGAAYSRVRQACEGDSGGGIEDSDEDGGDARAAEIHEMLSELFVPRLSRAAAAAIASTLHPSEQSAAPKPGVYTGAPTNPGLAERIAATRAKVTAAEAEARARKRDV